MHGTVHYDRYDEVVVRRLMDEHHLTAGGVADCAEAVRRLALAGYTDGQIAHRIGKRRRTVIRIRIRHGIPPAVPFGGNTYARPHPEAPTRPRVAG